jgi:hypothetical protein
LDQVLANTRLNTCPYASGFVTISNNTANWIHVGTMFEENSTLNIIDNTLIAYDISYVGPGDDRLAPSPIRYNYGGYTDIFVTGSLFTPIFNTAIRVLSGIPSGIPFGQDGAVVIRGNTTGAGYFFTAGGIFTPYYYDNVFVHCNTASTISENFLRGFNTTTANYGIIIGGITTFINQNKIYRGTASIGAYIIFSSLDFVSWDHTLSRGTIVDNFFDSPLINNSGTGSDFLENVVNLVSDSVYRWVVERNINQTIRLSFPVTNTQISSGIGSLGSSDTIPNNFGASTNIISNFRSGTNASTATYSYIQHKSNILSYTASAVGTNRLGWQENISKYMPPGARLIQLKMGIRSFTDGYVSSDSFVALTLNKYDSPGDYTNLDAIGAPISSITNFDPHVANNTNIATNPIPAPTGTQTYAMFMGDTINALAVANVTGYLVMDTEFINGTGGDISNQYIANAQATYAASSFGITLDCYLVKASGTLVQVLFSPVMIKYRW